MSNLLLFLVLVFSFSTRGQNVSHRIYLIGDAGKDTVPGSALMLLEEELMQHPRSTVMFLGDNIYPNGLVGKPGSRRRKLSEGKLLAQLERTRDHDGYVFWLPGNHDWKAGRWSGVRVLDEQIQFVESYYATQGTVKNDSGTVFIPKGALPGPVLQEVDDHGFNVIAIDIQWWLQSQFFHRVPSEKGLSKKEMEAQFLQRLDSLITQSVTQGRKVIVACHHPMYSNGHHGAPKQPGRFIFNWVPPFQLFGLLGLNRALVQDIPQPRYKRIRNRIIEVLNKYEGLVFVSGHEHNLQHFHKGKNHFLVSGAGSKRSSLRGDRYQAKYMDDMNYGFMRLDLQDDGRIRCHVFGHTMGGIIQSFWLD